MSRSGDRRLRRCVTAARPFTFTIITVYDPRTFAEPRSWSPDGDSWGKDPEAIRKLRAASERSSASCLHSPIGSEKIGARLNSAANAACKTQLLRECLAGIRERRADRLNGYRHRNGDQRIPLNRKNFLLTSAPPPLPRSASPCSSPPPLSPPPRPRLSASLSTFVDLPSYESFVRLISLISPRDEFSPSNPWIRGARARDKLPFNQNRRRDLIKSPRRRKHCTIGLTVI